MCSFGLDRQQNIPLSIESALLLGRDLGIFGICIFYLVDDTMTMQHQLLQDTWDLALAAL